MPVRCVSWSPDGEFVAAGRVDGTIALFRAKSGEAEHILHGHSAGVAVVAWSPDASRLASASLDATVRLWSAADGRPGPVLRGHEGAVRGLAWDPGGAWLASAGDDGSIRFWSPDGEGLRRIDRATDGDSITAMAMSPDGVTLAALAMIDGWRSVDEVFLLSARGERLGVLRGHDAHRPPSHSARTDAGSPPSGSTRPSASGTRRRTARSRSRWSSPKADRPSLARTADGCDGDAKALADDLLYLVEDPSGRLEPMTPAAFDRRLDRARPDR